MTTDQTGASAETLSAVPASNAGASSSDNGSTTLEDLRRDLREIEASLAQASTTLEKTQKKVEDLRKAIGEVEPVVTSYTEAHPALAKDLKQIDEFVRCKLDALQRDKQEPSNAETIKQIVANASSDIEAKGKAVDELRKVISKKGANEDRAVAEAERQMTWLKETQTRVQNELAGCNALRTRVESPDPGMRERYALLMELGRRVEQLKVPAPDKLEADLVAAATKLNKATEDQRDEQENLEENRRRLAEHESDWATLIAGLVEHILSQVGGPASTGSAQAR